MNSDFERVAQGVTNMRKNGHFTESVGVYEPGYSVKPTAAAPKNELHPLCPITDPKTCLTFLSPEDFAKITAKFSGADLLKKLTVLNTHYVNNKTLAFTIFLQVLLK
jgi:hypothetical protein